MGAQQCLTPQNRLTRSRRCSTALTARPHLHPPTRIDARTMSADLPLNGSLRVDQHQHDQRNHEHDSQDDRDAIQVLVHDARAGLGVVQRTLNGVSHARALARVQQDEHDQTCARKNQNHRKDNSEDIQNNSCSTLARLRVQVIRSRKTYYDDSYPCWQPHFPKRTGSTMKAKLCGPSQSNANKAEHTRAVPPQPEQTHSSKP